MGVGSKIRELRKIRKLSGGELAKRVGITQPYLSELERDIKNPSISVLQNIADKLQTTVAYLMDETNDPAPLDKKLARNSQITDGEGQVSTKELDEEMQALMQILSKDNLIRKSARMMQDMTEEEKYKVFQYIQDQELIARMKEEKEA